MVSLDDLTGIPEEKQREATKCLESLLLFQDETGRIAPIITGYNWYTSVPEFDRIVTLSHIHETEVYKSAMVKSLQTLGYKRDYILQCIRSKTGAFLPELDFIFTDDKGNLLSGLRIKDTQTGGYITASTFNSPQELIAYLKSTKEYLVLEDSGWELDMPFHSKRELVNLTNRFLRKYSGYFYDKEGTIINETSKQKERRKPWSSAYKTPVLLLGSEALKYAKDLPHFVSVLKVSLLENNNEISFVIHENMKILRDLPHYQQLRRLGFREEVCLANKPFILRYVDKKR